MSEGLLISLIASVIALGLSLFNVQQSSLRRVSAIVAEALRLAEPVVPFLRNSQVDNYIRDVLQAYARLDPTFMQSLHVTGETVEHVADVLPLLDPDLQTLGKALSLPTEQSRSLMSAVVHRVKDYDQMLERIQDDLQRLI